MPGVTGPVQQDDRAAHRVPEDDRPDYPERVAENADVIGARLKGPPVCLSPGRSSVPPQIEIDDLSMPSQPSEVRLEI